MVQLSPRTRGTLLSRLVRCPNIVTSPDNAGLHALLDAGQVRVDDVFGMNEHRSRQRLWRITHAGREWLRGSDFALILESTKTQHVAIEDALRAAIMALRSYQYGNAAPALAAEIADAGDAALLAAGLPMATIGASA